MATKDAKTQARKKEPEIPEGGGGIPIEDFVPDEQVDTGFEVPDFVPEELDAVQPARTEFWVAKIEAWLKDQVWQQVSHEQYDAIVKELKTRL